MFRRSIAILLVVDEDRFTVILRVIKCVKDRKEEKYSDFKFDRIFVLNDSFRMVSHILSLTLGFYIWQ